MINRFSARIMIKKVDSTKKLDNKKVLSAILRDNQNQGWISYYLRTGAKLFAEVLVYSDLIDIKDHPKGFQMNQKTILKGSISRRNSVRKIAKKVAKQCSSIMVVTMERRKGSLRQLKLESLSQFYLLYEFQPKYSRQIPKFLKLGEAKPKAIKSSSKDESRDDHKEKDYPHMNYISLLQKELQESTLGWPFHRGSSFTNQQVSENSEAKDVNYLPNLSNINSSSVSSDLIESPKSRLGWPLLMIPLPPTSDSSTVSETVNNENRSNSSCKRFKYKELKAATSCFSSENLIGKGGSSSVYKGRLPSGKSVAVKVLKPKKEAPKDFSLEVNIVSSIKHEHIAPLIGICSENGLLISVHDYYPKGSLEHCLHGDSGRSVLPWEVRFKVAIGVAEALNYLHNDCPTPVIHRDVKSSNILLTDELQPQLSDFGLAMWGSTDSANSIQNDVVGTFGYIAPEYFMFGRVCDKIDVYAFGVVLLELLTGRMPIGSKVPKGQESLVKWAKNLLEGDDYEALLDPKLKGVFDVAQMQRMVLAATRCISPSARVRSKVSHILKLLRGEKDAEKLLDSHSFDNSGYQNDDEQLEFGCMDRLRFKIL
ncbi:receptor-like cytosolic serine/threonine-protein kinase RBK1 [Morus notabilis]|uniref:receptor-like cytosolic serine/threonine-protein kinase RBK1 n=1 Tax=Morus notabilis TaxID=981085 RepID=UPI000CED2BB3|nr:receptor-like cytosolic serine/threonine-protein kinase RBK1 [Morus notabilis]